MSPAVVARNEGIPEVGISIAYHDREPVEVVWRHHYLSHLGEIRGSGTPQQAQKEQSEAQWICEGDAAEAV